MGSPQAEASGSCVDYVPLCWAVGIRKSISLVGRRIQTHSLFSVCLFKKRFSYPLSLCPSAHTAGVEWAYVEARSLESNPVSSCG